MKIGLFLMDFNNTLIIIPYIKCVLFKTSFLSTLFEKHTQCGIMLQYFYDLGGAFQIHISLTKEADGGTDFKYSKTCPI